MSSRSPFYINGNSIIFSTAIYTDSALTTPATDGFYSDGTNSVKQEGGVIVESYNCSDCVCSTQIVSENSAHPGVYNSSIVTGEGTGAIIVKITVDTASAPVGFRAYESFTGTQTYHNKIINTSDGYTPEPTYSFTYPAATGRFVQIGNTASGQIAECECEAFNNPNVGGGADCFKLTGANTELGTNKLIDSADPFGVVVIGDVVVNSTTGQSATVTSVASGELGLSADIFLGTPENYQIFNNYDVYSWDGNCFDDSAVDEGQPIYASDVFLIDYSLKTNPDEWYMVIPKTTATRSTLVMQAFASCISNNWSVEVGCPAPLTSFPISDIGDTACREVVSVAYNAPVTGTAGAPRLNDFIFSDSNGVTPYPDGTYVIASSSGDYIIITNGIITEIAPCT